MSSSSGSASSRPEARSGMICAGADAMPVLLRERLGLLRRGDGLAPFDRRDQGFGRWFARDVFDDAAAQDLGEQRRRGVADLANVVASS